MFSPQCLIDGLPFHVDDILWQPLIDLSKPDPSNPETPKRQHYVQSTFFALKFIQTRGIAWDVDCPYLGYFDENRKFEFLSAAKLNLEDIFTISKNRWSVLYLRQILESRGCLLGTFRCDEGLLSYKFVYSLTKTKGTISRHCVLIVGVGKNEQGEQYLEIQTSYGSSWGNKGFGFISFETLCIQGIKRVHM
ncbi:putative peptidase C1A, papain [Medicago truncatula]|uniref:Putative peptidase C1A, papain n=1 Tax=Medicago truncatula TaxID=3880 RepID=A0A396J0E5_MEDTR|nr:putative peptidase C1A, papain [Medicago truncatula]